MKASYPVLDQHRREFTFEVFGLDFMIDEHFDTWLIEVNTNPCLELCSPLLARLIPSMVENAFRVAVDPLFPPPDQGKHKNSADNYFESNKFGLIFSSQDESWKELKIEPQFLDNIVESEGEAEEEEQELETEGL